ncbi:MAG: hypothetical protein ACU0AT_01895 [Tranquillimonas sp.]
MASGEPTPRQTGAIRAGTPTGTISGAAVPHGVPAPGGLSRGSPAGPIALSLFPAVVPGSVGQTPPWQAMHSGSGAIRAEGDGV